MIGSGQRVALVGTALLLLAWLSCGCERAKPVRTAVVPVSPVSSTGAVVLARSTKTVEHLPSPSLAGAAHETPSASTRSSATTALVPSAEPTSLPSTPMPEPTDTSPLPTPTAPPSREIEYKVRAGDNLLAIAVAHQTTVDAIVSRNGLADRHTIRVGQVLIVPVDYEPSEMPAGGTVRHVVESGETLVHLAEVYRTTTLAILEANSSITDPEQLRVGMVLTITVGTAPASRTHKVKPGETASTIAEQYGISVQSLIRANSLVDPSRILVGQELVIPEQ